MKPTKTKNKAMYIHTGMTLKQNIIANAIYEFGKIGSLSENQLVKYRNFILDMMEEQAVREERERMLNLLWKVCGDNGWEDTYHEFKSCLGVRE